MDQSTPASPLPSHPHLTNDRGRARTIYQIYPLSFSDTNNDGIADIQGIIRKLPYIASLNVDTIWVSPLYSSPDGRAGDNGSAPLDRCAIDPRFGTLDDFRLMVSEAHRLDLDVLVDFVFCHTSHQHQDFRNSCTGLEPYKDFYVWHEGGRDAENQPIPPNNWKNVTATKDSKEVINHGRAWSWNDERRQWYLHHFLPSQPALNLYNPFVQDDILTDMKFWLGLGVDGFWLDALPFAHYDRAFRNNPWLDNQWPREQERWDDQFFAYSMCQPETVNFLRRIRIELDGYAAARNMPRPHLLGEVVAGRNGGHDAAAVAAEYMGLLDSCYTLASILWGTDTSYMPRRRATRRLGGTNELSALAVQ